MAVEHSTGNPSSDFINHHLTNLSVGEGFWALHLDTLFFSIALGVLLCWFLRRVALKAHAGVPGFAQNFAEMIFDFVDGVVKDFFGESRQDIGSLALTIFCWVLLWNIMDLLPVDLLPSMASLVGIPYLKVVPSMPIAGIDGTLRRSRVRQPGSSHLKTGTLNNASTLAGYVLANNGKHYVLVAMANGAGAAAARPAFEALVDWTMELPADMAPPSAHAAPDMPAQPAAPAVQNPAQDDPFAVVFPGAYAPQATTPGATPETADQ